MAVPLFWATSPKGPVAQLSITGMSHARSRDGGCALRLWRLPFALCSFLVQNRDRGLLKSRVIRMAMGGDGEVYVLSKSDGMIRKMTAEVASRSAAK